MLIGQTVSHYELLEKIGEGEMSEVFKAWDTKIKRVVVLKFLKTRESTSSDEYIRFVHEAQAGGALDHPNICTVYDMEEIEDIQFISMAYIDGERLDDIIKSNKLKPVESIRIAIQIAEGLNTAHKNGIIHRDVKSSNVKITKEGEVKILDFGIAKLLGGTRVTKSGTTLGTVTYMSYEQALGKEVDHRTDIWSLGVLLFEMIAGQLPFAGETEQEIIYTLLNEPPCDIKSIKADIPDELERIICKSMQKNPENRYQHLDDFIVDLKNVLNKIYEIHP
ncbi:MAG: serine/threonine-protein kinase [Candidatus Neomarinimicrobiota bacterium]